MKILFAFLKNIFNPFILRSAGSRHSPFAVVHHVGRKSGKPYTTPIIVQRVTGGLMAELTYGPKVDWYRNVVAAGGCHIQWKGQEYIVEGLEPVDAATGLAAFPWHQRLVLQVLHRQHFVRMQTSIS
jgi:deazaflavin-dependent oxidoreductase (nitroreductase family)